MVEVNLLDPSYAKDYRSLLLEAYASSPDAFTSTPDERALEPESWWMKRLDVHLGESLVIGAFAKGALVGTVALEFSARTKTRHKAQVMAMYVQAASRGQGIARRLLECLMWHAQNRPFLKVLTLTVTQGNLPAESLYGSFGFKVFGVEPMAIASGGEFLAKVHMFREI